MPASLNRWGVSAALVALTLLSSGCATGPNANPNDPLEPIAPVEVGHRSCSACLVAHIAMKTGRTLAWDPVRERFIGDE